MKLITGMLLLGTNLGHRMRMLQRARRAIARWPKTRLIKASAVLNTRPEGFLHQPNFLNQALQIQTALRPLPLLLWAKKTELELGRKPRHQNGPREIDIDIIHYGQLRLKDARLTLPHPRLNSSPSMRAALCSFL